MKKVLIIIRIAIGEIISLSSINVLIQKHLLNINISVNNISLLVNLLVAIILSCPKVVYWGKILVLKRVTPIVVTIMLFWFSGYSTRLNLGHGMFRSANQEHRNNTYSQKPLSFKEFLQEEGISIDSYANKYETLQKKNIFLITTSILLLNFHRIGKSIVEWVQTQ